MIAHSYRRIVCDFYKLGNMLSHPMSETVVNIFPLKLFTANSTYFCAIVCFHIGSPPYGSQLYPQLPHLFTVLLLPRKPRTRPYPFAPVVIEVDLQRGHRKVQLLNLTVSFSSYSEITALACSLLISDCIALAFCSDNPFVKTHGKLLILRLISQPGQINAICEII